jgi:hypothetical protein
LLANPARFCRSGSRWSREAGRLGFHVHAVHVILGVGGVDARVGFLFDDFQSFGLRKKVVLRLRVSGGVGVSLARPPVFVDIIPRDSEDADGGRVV